MTTQELHIALDILLQKVSSNWNKNFLPQEIDILINREITKFLKQVTNPLSNKKRLAMFDTLKRIQDANTLLKSVPLPIININQEEVGYRLPFDFLYYISSNINVIPVCKKTVITTSPRITYFKTIKPYSVLTGVLSSVLTLTVNEISTIIFDLSTLPPSYIPQDDIEDYKKVFILNNAFSTIVLANLPEEIEFRFNNVNQLFEFRSDVYFTLDFLTNDDVVPVTSSAVTYSAITNSSSLKSYIELIDEEFKDWIQGSHLSSTKGKHTKAYLRSNFISFPNSSAVLVKSAHLTYIRKPTRVNLLLNSNSELPDEILEEVISNVAESLKAIISSDTYEKYKDNNFLIE